MQQLPLTPPKRYFDTFDALRFFAFFKVFLQHIPPLAIPGFAFIKEGGGIGVSFFFVLSGFLITYLILKEKQQTGRLDLKKFFLRRILKIWPLYYLMILFAFCTPYILNAIGISPGNEGYVPNWFMSLTFLENYKMICENQFPNTSPLQVMWSLCVEEHFYIIWGIILCVIQIKRVPVLLSVSVVIALISRFIFVRNGWNTVDIFTNIDYFAYGAIPAYLLATREKLFEKQILQSPFCLRTGIIIITLLSVLIIPNLHLSAYIKELVIPPFLGMLFASVIAIVLPQNNPICMGPNNLFTRLGKYTYGLYLYHTIAIQVFIQLFILFGLGLSETSYSILFFAASLLLTIGVSVASFYLFENKFLQLKKYVR